MSAMEKKCGGCRKESCDGCRLNPGKAISSVKDKTLSFPRNFKMEKGKGRGIAFDVGTTTVAGILADLKSGEALAARTCVNPQRCAGSDMINRIVYCREKEENRRRLQKMIVDKLDELALALCAQAAEEERQEPDAVSGEALQEPDAAGGAAAVNRVIIVGNTVMCEILLGLDLKGLAKAPFHKEYYGSVTVKGGELSFDFLKDAEVTVLPSIEGYVGADALAVYTYIRQDAPGEIVLAADIGTNGEILLLGREKTYACSASAGPALEGASVIQGMGAAPGAIEDVRILGRFPRQDIYCKVIGDSEPEGICGSGLTDALSVLRQLRVIDHTGYLLSCREARKAGVPEQICRRISSFREGNRFLLTDSDSPVYLTTADIRNLQLAKGAIRAGMEILLKKEGITAEKVDRIYLAGAFGSYIKKESAIKIGLIPDVPEDKITYAGNCAGAGALMALLNPALIREMEKSAEEIIPVDLAREKRFQNLFMSFLAF